VSVTAPLAGTAEIFCGAAREIVEEAEDEDKLLTTRALFDELFDELFASLLAGVDDRLAGAGESDPPPEPPQEISVNNIKDAKNRTISDEKFIVTPWHLFSAKMVTSAAKSK
jgi:hypothetical protein